MIHWLLFIGKWILRLTEGLEVDLILSLKFSNADHVNEHAAQKKLIES